MFRRNHNALFGWIEAAVVPELTNWLPMEALIVFGLDRGIYVALPNDARNPFTSPGPPGPLDPLDPFTAARVAAAAPAAWAFNETTTADAPGVFMAPVLNALSCAMVMLDMSPGMPAPVSPPVAAPPAG